VTYLTWTHQRGSVRVAPRHELFAVGDAWCLRVRLQNIGSSGVDLESASIDVFGWANTQLPTRIEAGSSLDVDFVRVFASPPDCDRNLNLRVGTPNRTAKSLRLKLEAYEQGLLRRPIRPDGPDVVLIAAAEVLLPDDAGTGATDIFDQQGGQRR